MNKSLALGKTQKDSLDRMTVYSLVLAVCLVWLFYKNELHSIVGYTFLVWIFWPYSLYKIGLPKNNSSFQHKTIYLLSSALVIVCFLLSGKPILLFLERLLSS